MANYGKTIRYAASMEWTIVGNVIRDGLHYAIIYHKTQEPLDLDREYSFGCTYAYSEIEFERRWSELCVGYGVSLEPAYCLIELQEGRVRYTSLVLTHTAKELVESGKATYHKVKV